VWRAFTQLRRAQPSAQVVWRANTLLLRGKLIVQAVPPELLQSWAQVLALCVLSVNIPPHLQVSAAHGVNQGDILLRWVLLSALSARQEPTLPSLVLPRQMLASVVLPAPTPQRNLLSVQSVPRASTLQLQAQSVAPIVPLVPIRLLAPRVVPIVPPVATVLIQVPRAAPHVARANTLEP